MRDRRLSTAFFLILLGGCDPGQRVGVPPETGGGDDGQGMECVDFDGDGFGFGCELGSDCDEEDALVHDGCQMTCAFPHTGCACEPGDLTECHVLAEGARQCDAGTMACSDEGLWGGCEIEGEEEEGPPGSHEFALVQNIPVTCGNCDPQCFSAQDVPNAGDLNNQNSNSLQFLPNACWDENGDRDTNDPGECGALGIGGNSVNARYAWIANSPDSTVSKLDLATGQEVGRFFVGLSNMVCSCWCNGCNLPSRTAVDGYGNAYVANRAFGGQATVVKIAADPFYCVDRNRNGVIDTSTNNIPLAWGRDECILWTVNVGGSNAVARALAIDRGDANIPEGYVWVGMYNSQRAYRMNPRDGSFFCFQRDIAGNCTRDYVALGMSPYGATGDRRGWVWFTKWGTSNHLTAVDAATGIVIHRATAANPNCGSSNTYGIAVDRWGQLWTGGWECGAFRYNIGDAAVWGDERWCYVQPIRRCTNTGRHCTRDLDCSAGNTCTNSGPASRGVAADCEGNIWVAHSSSPSALQYLRDDTTCGANDVIARANTRVVEMRQPNGLSSGSGAIGAGVDFEGRIWAVNQWTRNVSVFNPNLWRTQTYPVGNGPYTYSDFTGYQRQNFVNPSGWYRHVYDTNGTCGAAQRAQFDILSWDAQTPANTEIVFEAFVGDTAQTLSNTPILLGRTPPDRSPIDLAAAFRAADVQPRVMSLLVTLRSLDGAATPLFRSVYVEFLCLDLE